MRILLIRDLQKIIPLSRSTFWRLEGQGQFPRRVRIGSRCGWVEAEVVAWLETQQRGMS